MANNTIKYMRIDSGVREASRQDWNAPVLWPVAAAVALIIAASVPAVMSIRRRRGR